ncbi:synaptotagmin-12-like [Eriocheir sinensis]|uniref:synaptotagmin-12-like n=1 Tax=Eriocheir sinensis TaxID=95602 RepID=UPI0021C59776|nr:synaptotagmin-12-like [Eriocheir sinensis]
MTDEWNLVVLSLHLLLHPPSFSSSSSSSPSPSSYPLLLLPLLHLTPFLPLSTRDTADLEVVVVEGRELVGPDPHVAVDSYVRVFLLPDKSTNMQTRVCRRTNNPTYRERFLFALEEEELPQRCLAFYMYASDKFTNTLIGEAQLRLADLDLSTCLATTLTLTDTGQRGVGYGEIMFSLSYLPTAERLTVVVVKARSLQWTGDKTTADPFVKVYVLQNGKKVMKKKTSVKKDTRSPVFNEAMIFSVPAPALHNIQLRVTVAEHSSDGGQARAVGHVIVGTQATGKALSHWNQMMSALRKPIGMWHPPCVCGRVKDL